LPRYHAGQYLLLQRADAEFSAFSLASAPQSGRELELHILARDPSSIAVIEHLRGQGFAQIKMPFGDTHLAELPDGPLVLIAAGTGMAQMHSLIEHCRAAGFRHPVHLYWGARRPEDFYALPCWAEWQSLPNLFLHQVVSERCDWQGRYGLLHAAVREDFVDLKPLYVYASGSPAMVYATLDALVEAGMDARQMRADVFAYAPRG
jgi:CDP-4-dehydro-6-deoxyglucose reductase